MVVGAAPGVRCGVGVRLGGGGLGSRRAVCWSEVGMRRSVTHRCFSEAARAAHPVHPCGPTAQHRAAVPPWGCDKTPRGPLGGGEVRSQVPPPTAMLCPSTRPASQWWGGTGAVGGSRRCWVGRVCIGAARFRRGGVGSVAWRQELGAPEPDRLPCPALGGGCEVLEGVMGRCGEAPSVGSGGSFGLSWC